MKNIYVTFTNKNTNIRALFKDQHSRVVLGNDVAGSEALAIHVGTFDDKNANSTYIKLNYTNVQNPAILGIFADTFANAGYSIEFTFTNILDKQQTFYPRISLLINEQSFLDEESGKLKSSAYKFNICVNRLFNRLFTI